MIPNLTDIFRARSHFWNELIPNANGGSRSVLGPTLLPDSSSQAGMFEAASPNNVLEDEGYDPLTGEPRNQFSTYLDGLDPSDPSNLLAQYILDSSLGAWEVAQLGIEGG